MNKEYSNLMRKFFFFLVFASPWVSAYPQGQEVFYFRINGTIDPVTERYMTLALSEAKEYSPDAILMELNTFGGALNSADSMRRMLLDYPIPVLVWINKNAASAGALISLACDSIYMNEGASIGAASVVDQSGNLAPGKYQSYMRSLMRATAEANGRNPDIAEQMVFVFQDSGDTEKQVITLTTQEAIDTGFCEGMAVTKEEALALAGYEGASVVSYRQSTVEQVISFFLNPALSSVLLLLILGGIYFELQSPGIGFPLAIAILSGLLYFVPYYLNGLAENWEILMLFIGLAFLALEIFVIPGFGIFGILGIGSSLASLVLVMLNNEALDFSFVPASSIAYSLLSVTVAVVLLVLLVFLAGVKLSQNPYAKRLVLESTLGGQALSKPTVALLQKGTIGKVISPLRPGGKIEVEGRIVDAISKGGYIATGEEVEVLQPSINSYIVRKLNKSADHG